MFLFLEIQASLVYREPFHEDIELDATSLDQNFLWKANVTEAFRHLLDDIKQLQQDNNSDTNVSIVDSISFQIFKRMIHFSRKIC